MVRSPWVGTYKKLIFGSLISDQILILGLYKQNTGECNLSIFCSVTCFGHFNYLQEKGLTSIIIESIKKRKKKRKNEEMKK